MLLKWLSQHEVLAGFLILALMAIIPLTLVYIFNFLLTHDINIRSWG